MTFHWLIVAWIVYSYNLRPTINSLYLFLLDDVVIIIIIIIRRVLIWSKKFLQRTAHVYSEAKRVYAFKDTVSSDLRQVPHDPFTPFIFSTYISFSYGVLFPHWLCIYRSPPAVKKISSRSLVTLWMTATKVVDFYMSAGKICLLNASQYIYIYISLSSMSKILLITTLSSLVVLS